MIDAAVRQRILEEARACLGLGGPEPWGTEAGVHGGASPGTGWCGLFARAVWRRAGLVVPDWITSDANTGRLRKTTDPQLGDLVCWRGKAGHQSLFVRFEGPSIIVTLDGNTIGKDRDGADSFSCVAERRRARAEALAYYSAPVETCSPKA